MTLLNSIILGIIEGITEFLPISSTWHLLFASKFLNLKANDFTKLFTVVIQSGAILAVFFLFFKKISKNPDLIKRVIVAFIPTALIGFTLYRVIKNVFFDSYFLILGVFISVGIIFLVFEYLVRAQIIKPEKEINFLTYQNALIIGTLQSLAVLPGVSRAGAVILAMMALGFKRADSAFFSFLLAVPTIISAGVYDLYKNQDLLINAQPNLFLLAAGFAVSFIFAYQAMRWLISYLQENTLNIFGWYRIILGIIILITVF